MNVFKNKNTKFNEKEINQAIYLVGTTRGLYAGHSSIVLVDKNGTGVLYSSQFDSKILNQVVTGTWIPYELFKKELSASDIENYFKTGRIPLDSNNKMANAYLSDYDKYIKIPVNSKELGRFMFERAEEIHKEPGLFNLYERNCNHLTQDILSVGALNFSPTRGSNDFVQEKFSNVKEYIKQWKLLEAVYYTIAEYKKILDLGIVPNGAYEKGVEWAKKNNYEYGEIIHKKRILETPKKEINDSLLIKLTQKNNSEKQGLTFGI